MKKLVGLLVVLLFACNIAYALPPEVELDRLLLKAKTSLDAGQFESALDSLRSAAALGVPLPENFLFHFARAQEGAERWEQASAAYEKYLEKTGTGGKYYREALEGLNRMEKAVERAGKEAAERRQACREEYKDDVEYWEEMVEKLTAACERLRYPGNSGCYGEGDEKQSEKVALSLENATEELKLLKEDPPDCMKSD